MDVSSDIFCIAAFDEMSFLVSEYHFKVKALADDWGSSISFNSDKVAINCGWNVKEGFYCAMTALVDTYWIRASDPHGFSVDDLVQMVAPDVLREKPQVDTSIKSDENLRPLLAYYAHLLKTHAQPILKGDLSLLEDIRITNYCNTAKSFPMDEYLKIFREECANLSLADRERLEKALGTRSRIEIWFLVQEFAHTRKVVTPKFLSASHDFWFQYMQ